MKKTLLILGILIVFSAATAQAGLNFGIKTLSLTQMGWSSYAYYNINQMLGCYFGVDVGSQVVIVGGMDFTRYHSKETDTPGGANPPAPDVYEEGFTSFTPNIGVKFYILPRTSGDITPYLQAGFFKTFTSATYEYPWSTPEYSDWREEIIKEIMSPFGFYPAFGVEYFVSDNFSVGGEMGIRFSFAKAEATLAGTTTKEELNEDNINHYIGITLNYRFGMR